MVILVLKDSEVKVAQMVEKLVWDGSRVSRTFEMVDIIRGRLFMLASRLRGGRYDHSMQLIQGLRRFGDFQRMQAMAGTQKQTDIAEIFF